jgi:DNA-binding winged helix-turn-helix (wHTH) protein/tetratricopeptide (TPR) repeat protein
MTTRGTPNPSAEHPLRVSFGRFHLDETDARLTRDGEPVRLAPKPFAVLCALARMPRSLVTKNALLDSVWGHRFVTESVLKSTISELRAALEDDPKQPRYIETVSRRGYRFIAAINPSAPPGAIQPAAALMIGRSDALERLRAAWRIAGEGGRRVSWVAGEAGVGKTTLIERFMAEVGDSHCARGHCVEQHGAGEPYFPVLEALTALCRRDAALAELVRAVAPTWLLQLPWLAGAAEREALRRELSGAGQARMLREMGELLDRYTENRPLLFVTEDLHWSDSATVQLMDYIARRRARTRLLWLGSFRLTEIIAAEHPLSAARHELRLHGLADEIVLDSFSEREVAEYVAERIPGLAADETFVRGLHSRTDGLPLFVADAVSDVVARGAQPGPVAIPESLTGVIERYIDELAPEERAALEAASACGVEFRLDSVARVLERDTSSLDELCAKLARHQRWLSEADGGYEFRHALYREVLYKRIAPVTRVELHRKIAASLERVRADGGDVSAAELAIHFELGREPLSALGHFVEAAQSALLNFSPSETMSLTERALALLPAADKGEARATLEITLAALRGAAAGQVLGIASDESKHAFERALMLLDEVPQHPLRGLFLGGLGLVLYIRGEAEQASALAERSEAQAAASGDRTTLVCACQSHGLVQYLRGRPRASRDWLERGLAAAEGLDAATSPAVFIADPGVIMLGLLAVALLHLGFADQARARLREARARADDLRAPQPKLAALWFEALVETRVDNPRRVAEIAAQIGALADEYALPQGRAAHLWWRGWAEARLGDPRAGHRLIREGYEEAVRLGMRAEASEPLGYAAEALARAGDWAAARRELDEALQCADAIGERKNRTQLLLLDARIADALGAPDRARESIREAVAEARAQEAPWLELMALSAQCELGIATAKDRKPLRLLVERLTEGSDTALFANARALLRG